MQETRSTKARLICGVDEAGRGPLAGPVTAAAVILPADFPVRELGDSKQLSAAKRDSAELLIKQHAVAYGVGWAWPDEIDSINILQAAMLAMQRAVHELLPVHCVRRDPLADNYPLEQNTVFDPETASSDPIIPDLILVDGNRCPDFAVPSRAEIKGDSRFPEIMAASILAKTARDRWMLACDALHPGYGFAGHKGYPTAAHKQAIADLGPSPVHRKTFRGVQLLS